MLVIDIQELGPRVRGPNHGLLEDEELPPAVRFKLPSAISTYHAPLLKSVFVHILSDKMNTGGVRSWIIDPLIWTLSQILMSNVSSNLRHVDLQVDEQWGELLWPLPKRLDEKPPWASLSKLQVTFIHPDAALVLLYSCPEVVDLALDVSRTSNVYFWDEDGWVGGELEVLEDDEDEDEDDEDEDDYEDEDEDEDDEDDDEDNDEDEDDDLWKPESSMTLLPLHTLQLSPQYHDDKDDSWKPESSATLPLLHTLHISAQDPAILMSLFERIRAPSMKHLELIFTDPRPRTAQFRQDVKRSMIRSRCKLEVLKLNVASKHDRQTEFTLPFHPDSAYCHTLTQIHLKQVTVPALLELLSVSPNVTILEVKLECIKVPDRSSATTPRDNAPIRLASLHTAHLVHRSFASFEGFKTCSGIDQFLRRIKAPVLKHLTIENNQHDEPWPRTEFHSFFSQTTLGISYLHLRSDALKDSAHLKDTLSHPNLKPTLQTLVFGGADELRLSDELLDWLTIPASESPGNDNNANEASHGDAHALPALRHLIIAFSSIQSPGKLSSMVQSRFAHGGPMEYFRTTFYYDRYGEVNDVTEDTKRLEEMKEKKGWDVDAVEMGAEIDNMKWVDEVRRRVGLPGSRHANLEV